VLNLWLVNIDGHANGAVIALDVDGVLEADGDTCQGTLQVDGALLDPLLGILDEDLGDAVGLFVSLEGYLAVGEEEVRGLAGVLVHLVDELLDGSVDGLPIEDAEGSVVGLERPDATDALILLEPAAEV